MKPEMYAKLQELEKFLRDKKSSDEVLDFLKVLSARMLVFLWYHSDYGEMKIDFVKEYLHGKIDSFLRQNFKDIFAEIVKREMKGESAG